MKTLSFALMRRFTILVLIKFNSELVDGLPKLVYPPKEGVIKIFVD